jgi:hypothetical protein
MPDLAKLVRALINLCGQALRPGLHFKNPWHFGFLASIHGAAIHNQI